ncbi:MAG: TIGR00268 family protein, partial [Fibrobacterota bacterium]
MFKDKSLKLLLEFFKNNSPCAIAVSGGADSGALLAFGAKTGASVGAYTVISALTPSAEKEKSGKLCEILGVPHKFITVQDSSLSEVFKNLPERCYECKKKIFSLIREKAFSDGYVSVAEGSNADDLDDYRPGMRALKELGIKSPLLEAGIFKKSVYAALRAERLDEFCDPPGACLATRFPCGTGFTKEDLVRT